MKKVLVGLSGGVDSAVCAALLLEQGFSVTGVYLQNGSGDSSEAQAVAETLGFPLIVRDVRDAMDKLVITPFRESYARGETPNSCIVCNPALKFSVLFEEANRLGAEHVATGHYARAEGGKLYTGHPVRDQSYMLYRLPPEWMARLLFPIGMMDKRDVRAQAARLGLKAAKAKDSMDICFIPDGDYAGFLECSGLRMPPGEIVGLDGAVLGTHRGLHHYTIGQRRGLGISSEGRLFVIALDIGQNRVVLGPESALLTHEVHVRDLHFHTEPEQPEFTCVVRLRHSPKNYACTVRGTNIRLAEAVRRPAPGQSAVFYRDDLVLGGGIITVARSIITG